MRKEIRKMYLYAVMKIVGSILGFALILYVCISYDDLVAGITCGILFGIAALIYFLSGFFTIKNGERHIREYINRSDYSKSQLDRECDAAQSYGRAHVGNVHLFANASNGFYVIPFHEIEEVWVEHHGENPAKGRVGYYYLYVKTQNHRIKMYYVSRTGAEEARSCIQERIEGVRRHEIG